MARAQILSKTQILDLYLNRVYFGAGAYGIEAAAQRYFSKPAQKLTVAEAATLAGLVRSPTRLAPTRNPGGAEKRAQVVLAAMVDMKFITDDMAKTALMQPAQAVKVAGAGSIGYVADWTMDVLDDLIGHVDQDIVVETTIDPALQTAAETALVDELTKNGPKAGVGQGAVVALTPDGAVRALVGGKNYAESQFNRAVAAKRQPGSAFKPFVYLTAIERGLTPDTVREDKPIAVKGWHPENYSREYFGPVSLTKALALSLNTVSVRLTLEFGPTAVMRTAHRLGIASKLEPNASLALGTSEVSVLELVGAYATFANGGMALTPHVVERVHSASGKLLYQHAADNLGRVVEAGYVGMMNSMMQETLLTGTAHKAELPGWPAAGKTGTSQDFRDAWFVGYTGHLVAGVWLGNDNSSPTKKTTGGGLPVEIWSKFMKAAHHGVPVVGLPGVGSAPSDREPVAIRRVPAGAARASVRSGRAGPLRGSRRRHRQLVHQPVVRAALARRFRLSHHSSSDRLPAVTMAMASGHALCPEDVTEDRADDRRRCLGDEAEQRRRSAGPVRIRQQRAGLRLGQRHAHADEVEAHRPRSRRSPPSGVSASSSSHGDAAARPWRRCRIPSSGRCPSA